MHFCWVKSVQWAGMPVSSVSWVLLYLFHQLHPSLFLEPKGTPKNHVSLQIYWNCSRLQTENNLLYWIEMRHGAPCQASELLTHFEAEQHPGACGGIVPVSVMDSFLFGFSSSYRKEVHSFPLQIIAVIPKISLRTNSFLRLSLLSLRSLFMGVECFIWHGTGFPPELNVVVPLFHCDV